MICSLVTGADSQAESLQMLQWSRIGKSHLIVSSFYQCSCLAEHLIGWGMTSMCVACWSCQKASTVELWCSEGSRYCFMLISAYNKYMVILNIGYNESNFVLNATYSEVRLHWEHKQNMCFMPVQSLLQKCSLHVRVVVRVANQVPNTLLLQVAVIKKSTAAKVAEMSD